MKYGIVISEGNLDLYLMERGDVVATFERHSAEINLVEGNKGLYDGLVLDGSNSSAALAKLLDLPVFLVIDARSMTRDIAGVIPGDVRMHDKPVGRGYVHLREEVSHPWPRPDMIARQIRAHEFHYSSLENLPADSRFAYHVERGFGIVGKRVGLMLRNLLASYTHLRTTGSCYWATRFVAFIRSQLEQRLSVPAYLDAHMI